MNLNLFMCLIISVFILNKKTFYQYNLQVLDVKHVILKVVGLNLPMYNNILIFLQQTLKISKLYHLIFNLSIDHSMLSKNLKTY